MSEIYSPADRPNVLFIMADDHRHDAIAACGNPCAARRIWMGSWGGRALAAIIAAG